MTDTGRESLTFQAERTVKPDSQKSTAEQAGDSLKSTYDSAASTLQPGGEKGTGQKVTDTVKGDFSSFGTGSGGGESMIDKAKASVQDAVGLGDKQTT
ncbi:hypothetical protein JCM11641_004153 [Rhodosporidiobolus odoratus]